MVKLDAFGNEQWRRTYGGPEHDIIDDFKQTSDGGYLLCGTSFVPGPTSFDFRLIKTDYLGNVIWNKTYGTAAIDFSRSAIETSDGGYAIVGRSDNGTDVGILLIKTDANGNEIWSNTYGGIGDDEAWGIAETIDNQLIITGQSASFGAGDQDVYLAKIDLDGNFQWFQTFGGSDNDFAFDVQAVATGGYVVGGSKELWRWRLRRLPPQNQRQRHFGMVADLWRRLRRMGHLHRPNTGRRLCLGRLHPALQQLVR
ncbi:MAG: hypothetical protein IPN76_34810 [Saprospiraceae bacterium]|nr:hypothetical protein [Saprospiraceae bacterium]